MKHENSRPSECSVHGQAAKRSTCRSCNAVYMREYMRQRRLETPGGAILQRARRRAREGGLHFSIGHEDIMVPSVCPALGIRIKVGKRRSGSSPSLDRVIPCRGYVPGNVRVISDKANRLKSNLTPAELRRRATKSPEPLHSDYLRIAEYAEQEALLAEVCVKAMKGGREGTEWEKIARFLAKAFSKGRA